MKRMKIAAAVIAPVLAVSACGGSDDSPPSDAKSSDSSSEPSSDESSDDAPAALSADPATGDELSTDDFSFTIPEGWKSQPDAAPQALSFALDSDPGDSFPSSVNVVQSDPFAAIAPDDRGEAAIKDLKNTGAKDVEAQEPISLDGEPAVTVTSLFNLNDLEYRVWQYAAARGDKGFVVTFSFAEDVPLDEQQKLAESVAATWSWAS